MSSPARMHPLRDLAQQFGIQTAYYDMSHHRRQASPEALLAALKVLGAPVSGAGDILPAWREKRQDIWQRPLPPVIVAWPGERPRIEVRLPYLEAGAVIDCCLKLESGEERRWQWRGGEGALLGGGRWRG